MARLSLASKLAIALLINTTMTAVARDSRMVVQQAKAVAAKCLRTEAGVQDMAIVRQTPHIAVVSAQNVGTVFVTRDESQPVVIGYTTTPYALTTMPEPLEMWLSQADQALAEGTMPLTANVTRSMNTYSPVDPMLTTRWNQEAPFNMYCPTTDKGSCPAGCVAIAMAQIFNYYKYPAKRRNAGGALYFVDDEPVELKPMRWLPTKYAWDAMRDMYGGRDTDEGAKAVATLSRDCGYSVYMSYANDGSAASSFDVPEAASRHFDYDSLTINTLLQSYYTHDEWYDMMYSELASGNPVLYGGSYKNEGGHAFVFHGLKEDGMVYVNWGWAGSYDGWYDVSLLTPGGDQNFTEGHHMVLGFRPWLAEPDEKRGPYAHSLLTLRKPRVEAKAGDLSFSMDFVGNGDWRYLKGDVVFVLMPENDEEGGFYIPLMLSDEEEESILPPGYGWRLSQSIGFLGLFDPEQLEDMATGKYYFAAFSQSVDEDEMQIARVEGVGRALWAVQIDADHKVTSCELVEDQHEIDIFTSIDAPRAATRHGLAGIYDLQGRPANPRTHHGLVIQDGRKLLKK